ncbi:unnamed protein product [Dibothriocephalus latus]|uniref:Uncharacterized protein n=1 Tax=Dibothriocephalus latus TaxID=60516 RepID=A0A3P7NBA6_DIBLA|nr:unnamed protein product [Dibothriocephalus latus]
MVRCFTVDRAPGYVVYWATLTFIFCVVGLLGTVLLVPYSSGGIGAWIWRIVGATLWLLLICCCMGVIGMHRQFPAQRAKLYRVSQRTGTSGSLNYWYTFSSLMLSCLQVIILIF